MSGSGQNVSIKDEWIRGQISAPNRAYFAIFGRFSTLLNGDHVVEAESRWHLRCEGVGKLGNKGCFAKALNSLPGPKLCSVRTSSHVERVFVGLFRVNRGVTRVKAQVGLRFASNKFQATQPAVCKFVGNLQYSS